jgi:hypothetical protein
METVMDFGFVLSTDLAAAISFLLGAGKVGLRGFFIRFTIKIFN